MSYHDISPELLKRQAAVIYATQGMYFGDSVAHRYSKEKQAEKEQPLDQGLQHALASVEELFIAGGGGAGRTLPGAFLEARKYGLDMDRVKVVCGTSVGSIVALGVTLKVPLEMMVQNLDEMPTDKFQDWSFESLLKFPVRWGLCKGEAMPDYFRQMIKRYTGLDDPTFQELYEAGFKKELRVVTTE